MMGQIFSADCTEVVSILYAIMFGVGDACISFSTHSIFVAFAAFILLVIVAQFFARRLWARVMRVSDTLHDTDETPITIPDDPDYSDSPIRSTRR